jgi:hypothetical protein
MFSSARNSCYPLASPESVCKITTARIHYIVATGYHAWLDRGPIIEYGTALKPTTPRNVKCLQKLSWYVDRGKTWPKC